MGAGIQLKLTVVSYRNSTSNHNFETLQLDALAVVSYRNSTSNHNSSLISSAFVLLYLIEILHQTTTIVAKSELLSRCILSKFYIKPQPSSLLLFCLLVVSYRNSTSNHNSAFAIESATPVVSYRNSTSNHNTSTLRSVSIIVVSYRNSTSNHNNVFAIKSATPVVSYRNSTSNHNATMPSAAGPSVVSYRNSTSNHNLTLHLVDETVVVSYRNSTSNHNSALAIKSATPLYLIEILHQTTTTRLSSVRHRGLYLIEILHQTTTSGLILIDKVLLTGCLPL